MKPQPEPITTKKPLPTLWNVPDPLWELIEKVLTVYDPPAKTGRKRSDPRLAFDGIIYRMRTGCQWNHLPQEFGDSSNVYRAFVRWEEKAIFDILWAILLTKCDLLQGVGRRVAVRRWLLGQGARRPRQRGRKKGAQDECVGPNPTDRAKSGVKKSVLVEGNGRPLAVAIGGANTPDAQLLKATLEAVVGERPAPTEAAPPHLCLDKGYDNAPAENAPAEAVVTEAGYVPHMRS